MSRPPFFNPRHKAQVLALDTVAQRYGQLPSRVLKESSLDEYNFDQQVCRVAIEQEIKEKKEALAKAKARRG